MIPHLLTWTFGFTSLIIFIVKILPKARCKSARRLDGKTAIVTGSNTGIGKETVKDFYKRGARVIMACRNLEKADKAKRDIEESCKNLQYLGELVTAKLDLCSLESVRDFVKNINRAEQKIDILLNNAGVMTCPEARTKDGFELQFGSNHLGHFLLTLLLLPKLKRSQQARIVTVSSLAYMTLLRKMLDDLNWRERRYNRFQAYALSKTANILFSRELARKLKENNINNVTTYSLHPGVIKTDLGRHLGDFIPGLTWVYYNFSQLFSKTPFEGAQTSIYCAVDEKCANESGLYYSECAVARVWGHANNDAYARNMWDKSWEMVALEEYDPFK